MRKIITAVALIAAAILTTAAFMKPDKDNKTDSDGHVLVSLWSDYEKAAAKDLPQKQAEILEEIIAGARTKRLSWDFYDAWTKYRQVRINRNWKDSDEVKENMETAILKYDDPIVSFRYYRSYGRKSSAEMLEYVQSEASRLKAQKNDAFYRKGSCSSEMGGELPSYLENDYEFALWETGSYGLLKEYYGESYPCSAYAEYKLATEIKDDAERSSEFRRLADLYKGKAVGLYAEGELLIEKMAATEEAELKFWDKEEADGVNNLADEDKKDADEVKNLADEVKNPADEDKKVAVRSKAELSAAYRALYDECSDFESRRKALGGKEAAMVKDYRKVEFLMKTLTDSDIAIRVENDSVFLAVRNLSSVKLSVSEDTSSGTVLDTEVKNPSGSFYVRDTLLVVLPKMDDGSYKVEAVSGKTKEKTSFSKYSLSIACRRDSEGYKVYAAESLSGRPLESAGLVMVKNGTEVFREKDFRFDGGFTAVPPEIDSMLAAKGSNARYVLSCFVEGEDGLLKKSRDLSVYRTNISTSSVSSERKYCNVCLDRGAYQPGDTLYFKAISYQGNLADEVKVAPEGTSMSAELIDSEGNKIGSASLETNDFGSVAGSFEIPEGLRNGIFKIRVEGGGYSGSASFRVEEYVLPSFVISFDPVEKFYLPGDLLKVSGKVSSYSGHSLSGAAASYVISGSVAEESGTLSLAADGSFELECQTDKERNWGWYSFSVRITDPTGETQEASTTVSVSSQLYVTMDIKNDIDAETRLADNPKEYDVSVVDSDRVSVEMKARGSRGLAPVDIDYEVKDEQGKVLKSGKIASGGLLEFEFPDNKSGLYSIGASVSLTDNKGEEISDEAFRYVLRLSDSDKVIDAPVEYYYKAGLSDLETGSQIVARLGCAEGPIWAVAELFGDGLTLLERRMVYLEGKRGEAGSLASIEYEYKAEYPDAVSLSLLFFKDDDINVFTTQYRRVRHTLDFPLEWTRFEDKTLPGHEYSYSLRTSPETELLATIYDKSVDRIKALYWNTVSLRQFSVPSASYSSQCGGFRQSYGGIIQPRYAMTKGSRLAVPEASVGSVMEVDVVNSLDSEEVAMDAADAVALDEAAEALAVREDFASTLAFEPFLRSDENGDVRLDFRTSDKLSTFNVRVFAHDKSMRNALLAREMTVTIPVKLSVAEPQYLYAGDRYQIAVSLSSNSDRPLSGTMYLYQYDGTDHENSAPVRTSSFRTMVPASGSVSHLFDVDVPASLDGLEGSDGSEGLEGSGSIGTDGLKGSDGSVSVGKDGSEGGEGSKGSDRAFVRGLKAVFVADDGYSDGVFVSVPVYAAAQKVTEAHSAVVLPGMDKDAVLERLRGQFVNVSPDGAEYKEISIIDMVREAIPSSAEAKNNDILSLTEAYYIRRVASSLAGGASDGAGASGSASGISGPSDGISDTDEAGASARVSGAITSDRRLWEMMLACRNADGGFGWFEGMDSSPVLTTMVLERFAKLQKLGLVTGDEAAGSTTLGRVWSEAVSYLDNKYFEVERPYWCGGISADQYIYLRSLYPSVPFEVNTSSQDSAKRMKEFREYAKEYLTPKDKRGLEGQILDKARRLRTLSNLVASEEGLSLASAWGVKFGAKKKLMASLEDDVQSLLEYAVGHEDGGMYYPNAVMPFRGLLESEAYAHSLLCDLLTDYGNSWGTAASKGSAASGAAADSKASAASGRELDAVSGASAAYGTSAASKASAASGSASDSKKAQALKVADGIRIWLMLQKETQKWETEPAFVDAINSVLSGSDEVKSTMVILLSKSYEKPFSEIKAAGNGFSVERKFYVQRAGASNASFNELRQGDELKVGDKIRIEYKIWNAENRSFVLLKAAREAALRPVSQLSGMYGWGIRPLRVNDWYSFQPHGYRNVKSAVSEYYFDTYPEENTTVTEEFFVTQAGSFSAPVIEIESLYAPHYRANGVFTGTLEVRQ